jgi:hypothetical protein
LQEIHRELRILDIDDQLPRSIRIARPLQGGFDPSANRSWRLRGGDRSEGSDHHWFGAHRKFAPGGWIMPKFAGIVNLEDEVREQIHHSRYFLKISPMTVAPNRGEPMTAIGPSACHLMSFALFEFTMPLLGIRTREREGSAAKGHYQ